MKDEHVIRSCLRTDINAKKIINDVVVQRSIVQSLGNAVFTSSLLEESTKDQPLQEPFMSQGFVQACMNLVTTINASECKEAAFTHECVLKSMFSMSTTVINNSKKKI